MSLFQRRSYPRETGSSRFTEKEWGGWVGVRVLISNLGFLCIKPRATQKEFAEVSSWGAVAEGLTRWGRRSCEWFPVARAVIFCWEWVSVSNPVGERGCSGGSFAMFRRQPQHSTLVHAKAIVKLQEMIEVECEAESQGNTAKHLKVLDALSDAERSHCQ